MRNRCKLLLVCFEQCPLNIDYLDYIRSLNNLCPKGGSERSELTPCRAGGTGPVGQAKTGPLFSANSVMIVAFTNAICMNVVMIITISM